MDRTPASFASSPTVAPAHARARSPAALLAAFVLPAAVALSAGEDAMPALTSVGSPRAPAAATSALILDGNATRQTDFFVRTTTSSWSTVESLQFEVDWPAQGATNAQVLVHMTDWDYLWFQTLLPGVLVPGERNRLKVDFSPDAVGWEPRGHKGAWHSRVLNAPRQVGLRIFYAGPSAGTCTVENASCRLAEDTRPPFIHNVKPSADSVPCFEKFELAFQIPDRYPDPFDAQQVQVVADFEGPDGQLRQVEGFYGQDFYRTLLATGEKTVPQGPPLWRVRFAPVLTGVYRYTLRVRDSRGQAMWGPATFTATPGTAPGFVRVSARDRRCFEFDNGTYFFPIGHNTRSTFDTRMDDQFPWMQRWPEGTAAYTRYFRDMHANGENLAEVWTASWSLGLEWNAEWPGYHGIGQYNMRNAWELDRVVADAEASGIYLNLVIHNHGKFSAFSDEEWSSNPFNRANGGYLRQPEDYFSDPRAMQSFRKLMRYMIARWGWSTRIFAWELWSELDLTGSRIGGHRSPEVTDWHRLMGRAIKDMDPYDHMVATHVCGDYTHQSEDLISLPEIDFCPVNAYHHSANPLHLVNLLRETCNFNVPYNKPVIVTEFGGSHMAAGIKHLGDGLHAGLWASTGLPLGGTPLFWWWQVIEEQGYYPKYAAVERFMRGEDRRDPAMQPLRPELLAADSTPMPQLDAQCMRSPTRAIGWIYHQGDDYALIDPSGAPVVTNLVLRVRGVTNGAFRAEFWDTSAGRICAEKTATVENGLLSIAVPPFARDVAFKLKAKP